MLIYRKRNRADNEVSHGKKFTPMRETELVLKLKKEELFDPYILLPHAELNSAVYQSVDAFVQKYQGAGMTVSVCTDPVSPMIQDVFREVYRAHYREELLKVERYLTRHGIRAAALVVVAVAAFFLGRMLARTNPSETIFSYIVLNISGFCLWEVGYTQFAARNVLDEKRRISRALNAVIDFHGIRKKAGGSV